MLESFALADLAETITLNTQEEKKMAVKAEKTFTFNWEQDLNFEEHHPRYSKNPIFLKWEC